MKLPNRISLFAILAFALALAAPSINAQTFPIEPNGSCAAVGTLQCTVLIGPYDPLGPFPNVAIHNILTQGPATYTGTVSFETFQTNPNEPYLNNGVISLSAPVWNTVTDPNTGLQSVQVTDLTIYGFGSYAGLYQPTCTGAPLFEHCYKFEATMHFKWRAQLHQGGTWTWAATTLPGSLDVTYNNY